MSLFIDDDYLKQKSPENLKIFRINFDKAAVYEMNIQDNCTFSGLNCCIYILYSNIPLLLFVPGMYHPTSNLWFTISHSHTLKDMYITALLTQGKEITQLFNDEKWRSELNYNPIVEYYIAVKMKCIYQHGRIL